jgi:hypothetical protein
LPSDQVIPAMLRFPVTRERLPGNRPSPVQTLNVKSDDGQFLVPFSFDTSGRCKRPHTHELAGPQGRQQYSKAPVQAQGYRDKSPEFWLLRAHETLESSWSLRTCLIRQFQAHRGLGPQPKRRTAWQSGPTGCCVGLQCSALASSTRGPMPQTARATPMAPLTHGVMGSRARYGGSAPALPPGQSSSPGESSHRVRGDAPPACAPGVLRGHPEPGGKKRFGVLPCSSRSAPCLPSQTPQWKSAAPASRAPPIQAGQQTDKRSRRPQHRRS